MCHFSFLLCGEGVGETLGIYARQSVDKKDSISIESQIEACKAQVIAFGLSEEIRIYIDKGYSGKNTNRPEFGRLMGDIKSGIVSKVFVYKLDRISRSLLDFARIIETFKELNIDFVSSQEKFDTSTPMGNAMLSIVMVFAQLERETIQLRIKDNFYARGRLGMYLGGPAPYGYKKIETELNGKKTCSLEPNSAEGIITDIFSQYANTDKSLGKITTELNETSVPTPSGAPWDSCKLSRIMRNPVYVKADTDIFEYYKTKGCNISNGIEDFIGEFGCYLYGKRQENERKYTNVKDHTLSLALHKGIIPSDIFLTCQYKLDNNKQIKRSGASTLSWLSGLTKCPYCGYAMTINCPSGTKPMFICSGRKNHIPCERHILSFKVSAIEMGVETKLLQELRLIKNKEILSQPEPKINNEHSVRLVSIKEQIQNLIEQLALGNAVVNTYINSEIEKLDEEKKLILEQMQKTKTSATNKPKVWSYLEMIDAWGTLPLEVKKEVARTFLERVDFYDAEIVVNFKENVFSLQGQQ